ncbi:hypothetical protein Tco_1409474 [Tanacetum coccineum]
MAFRNFMYAETDDDLTLLPKEPSLEFGTGSLSVSINMEPPIAKAVPTGASSSRSTRAKASALRYDSPFLTILDDDEVCLMIYMTNVMAECDVLKDREKERDQECEELKAKCEAAMADIDKNPVVSVLHDKIASLSGEVKEHIANLDRMLLESQKWAGYQNAKLDRAEVVSKVVPYVAMELVYIDDRGADLSPNLFLLPFFMDGAYEGYRNELAIAIFPFLAELVADPHASVQALLSKKHRVLQRPTLIRTHVPASSTPSQKATPSPALMSLSS